MTDQELIEWLRGNLGEWSEQGRLAADRIEQLTGEKDRAMTDQELDEQVARRVFEWCSYTIDHTRLPCFTRSASDDYFLLEYVRANWSEQDRVEFRANLRTIYSDEYEPGDYSRAALAVLEAKGGA